MTKEVITDAEVVIVGAGPVGTALAIDLGLAGIETVVLEQRAGAQRPHPGTNLTNIRSMEHFRRWGAIPHLDASNSLGPQWAPDVQFPTRADGVMVAKLEGVLGSAEPFPFASATPRFGPQASIEAGLRSRLTELPSVEVRYEACYRGLDDRGDRVVVEYERDGRQRTISSRYAVGADGAASAVRKHIGIRLEGNAGVMRGCAYYVKSPELLEIMRQNLGQAPFVWFANEDETGVILIAQDDHGVFQYSDLPIPDDEDGGNWEQMKARLLKGIGVDVPIEPIEGGKYNINSLVAPRFHKGRVFLVGEAAHQISVFGGFGMNTGITDAGNLGWKLTGTIRGWAGPALLDSYSEEQVPVISWIRDLTEESTTHVGGTWVEKGMESPGPEGDVVRTRVGERIIAAKQKELVSLGAQFGAAYRDSSVILSEAALIPVPDFGELVSSAAPGLRIPHVWLAEGHSLFDDFALDGFTLIRVGDADVMPLVSAATERGVPLKVLDVIEPELVGLYGAKLVLGRPDHYVAWRGDALPDDVIGLIDTVRGAGARVSPRGVSGETLATA